MTIVNFKIPDGVLFSGAGKPQREVAQPKSEAQSPKSVDELQQAMNDEARKLEQALAMAEVTEQKEILEKEYFSLNGVSLKGLDLLRLLNAASQKKKSSFIGKLRSAAISVPKLLPQGLCDKYEDTIIEAFKELKSAGFISEFHWGWNICSYKLSKKGKQAIDAYQNLPLAKL